eukprot:CAMPEP_0167742314 /NCGR_PEP_ID=MMETSP0110_2-20121227/1358_1 /TAXON_ID=629695 /ORGANISM="Gymnochlora sp., Strain CCMP2014" /LENGTH=816 /DNA_ID=CAMNT_0007626493 /DNA_START=113 /DNA_END=2563 /DNA_ORIENTATION=-
MDRKVQQLETIPMAFAWPCMAPTASKGLTAMGRNFPVINGMGRGIIATDPQTASIGRGITNIGQRMQTIGTGLTHISSAIPNMGRNVRRRDLGPGARAQAPQYNGQNVVFAQTSLLRQPMFLRQSGVNVPMSGMRQQPVLHPKVFTSSGLHSSASSVIGSQRRRSGSESNEAKRYANNTTNETEPFIEDDFDNDIAPPDDTSIFPSTSNRDNPNTSKIIQERSLSRNFITHSENSLFATAIRNSKGNRGEIKTEEAPTNDPNTPSVPSVPHISSVAYVPSVPAVPRVGSINIPGNGKNFSKSKSLSPRPNFGSTKIQNREKSRSILPPNENSLFASAIRSDRMRKGEVVEVPKSVSHPDLLIRESSKSVAFPKENSLFASAVATSKSRLSVPKENSLSVISMGESKALRVPLGNMASPHRTITFPSHLKSLRVASRKGCSQIPDGSRKIITFPSPAKSLKITKKKGDFQISGESQKPEVIVSTDTFSRFSAFGQVSPAATSRISNDRLRKSRQAQLLASPSLEMSRSPHVSKPIKRPRKTTNKPLLVEMRNNKRKHPESRISTFPCFPIAGTRQTEPVISTNFLLSQANGALKDEDEKDCDLSGQKLTESSTRQVHNVRSQPPPLFAIHTTNSRSAELPLDHLTGNGKEKGISKPIVEAALPRENSQLLSSESVAKMFDNKKTVDSKPMNKDGEGVDDVSSQSTVHTPNIRKRKKSDLRTPWKRDCDSVNVSLDMNEGKEDVNETVSQFKWSKADDKTLLCLARKYKHPKKWPAHDRQAHTLFGRWSLDEISKRLQHLCNISRARKKAKRLNKNKS